MFDGCLDRTQSAAEASERETNLNTHPYDQANHPGKADTYLTATAWHRHLNYLNYYFKVVQCTYQIYTIGL